MSANIFIFGFLYVGLQRPSSATQYDILQRSCGYSQRCIAQNVKCDGIDHFDCEMKPVYLKSPISGRWFFRVGEGSYDQASSKCELYNATLPAPSSKRERKWLQDNLADRNSFFWLDSSSSTTSFKEWKNGVILGYIKPSDDEYDFQYSTCHALQANDDSWSWCACERCCSETNVICRTQNVDQLGKNKMRQVFGRKYVMERKASAFEAMQLCRQHGAYLPTLSNNHHQTQLFNKFRKTPFWIGLYGRDVHSAKTWFDKTMMNYTAQWAYSPARSTGSFQCAYVNGTEWNVTDCETSHLGIMTLCEKRTCKSTQAVSLEKRCDGLKDCDDGSDERDCRSTLMTSPLTGNKYFLAHKRSYHDAVQLCYSHNASLPILTYDEQWWLSEVLELKYDYWLGIDTTGNTLTSATWLNGDQVSYKASEQPPSYLSPKYAKTCSQINVICNQNNSWEFVCSGEKFYAICMYKNDDHQPRLTRNLNIIVQTLVVALVVVLVMLFANVIYAKKQVSTLKVKLKYRRHVKSDVNFKTMELRDRYSNANENVYDVIDFNNLKNIQ
ncbi:hypothetical protein HDE_04866 [Halotydeus destructor]|nr:hypothetical protein HDE_04866 [Halotydeus destructor]